MVAISLAAVDDVPVFGGAHLRAGLILPELSADGGVIANIRLQETAMVPLTLLKARVEGKR